MNKRISLYIFCEIGRIRDKKTGEIIGPTVGAAQHIALCMRDGCECETFLAKVRELREACGIGGIE